MSGNWDKVMDSQCNNPKEQHEAPNQPWSESRSRSESDTHLTHRMVRGSSVINYSNRAVQSRCWRETVKRFDRLGLAEARR